MKSFHTLLKIAQRKLDELGIEAAKLGLEASELRGRIDDIRAREQAEIANAARDSMFASMLPAYRLRVRWQVDEISHQATAKDKQLADIREKLSSAYIEKSKFEQLIQQHDIRRDAERAAIEQAQLDEVAINRAGGMGR